MGKCPYCGADNPGYVFYCGRCGSEIPLEARYAQPEQKKTEKTKEPEAVGQPPEPTPPAWKPPPQMIRCVFCGAEQEAGRAFCPFCGKEPQGPWVKRDEYNLPPYIGDIEAPSGGSASGTLVLGGVLAIIAGVLALGQGLLYTVAGGSFAYGLGGGFLCLCGGLDVLFGFASIVAGVFAIQRKGYVWAVMGSVLGMLGLGLMIGFILGLIALILIATSKNEFYD